MKKFILTATLLILFTGSVLSGSLIPTCKEDQEWVKYACGSGDPFACIGALIRQKMHGCGPHATASLQTVEGSVTSFSVSKI